MLMAKAPGYWPGFYDFVVGPIQMDMVGTGFCPGYWRGLLAHVVDPCYLLAWDIGLVHVTGLECWPRLLAHSFDTNCWALVQVLCLGSCPRLLSKVVDPC